MNTNVFKEKWQQLKLVVESPTGERESFAREDGAIGYIALWLMGVPAGVLFLIFLMRGCN